MPFISTTTTESLNKNKKDEMAKRLGSAISLIPGKSEAHLMLGFYEETTMYFAGKTNTPMAFFEVKTLGTAHKDDLSALTAELCKIAKEVLNIESEFVYVKYEEIEHWGWNGSNF